MTHLCPFPSYSTETPKLLLNNTPEEHGEFILYLLKVHLVVNQQMVCMPFTSMGYPNVMYDMYYKPLDKDNYLPVTNQSCLEHNVVHRDVSHACVHVYSLCAYLF